jgi:hypothetical protein
MTIPVLYTGGRAIPLRNVRLVLLLLAVLIAAGVLFRLPQLRSRNLLVEGDECILGLMGMHVAAGQEFPLFFYGQSYGLAVIEAPAAAASFLVAGAGAVPLKLAMLAVWLAGVCFYFLAFAPPLGVARSFWTAMLLVLMPAWAATSMKAWSGYVTAFSLTGVALSLVIPRDARERAPWVAVGAVTAAIFLAQPLWLPSLMPPLAWFLIRERRFLSWLGAAAGATAVLALTALLRTTWNADLVESWFRPQAGNPHLLGSLSGVLWQIYVNLTGWFYFGAAIHPGRVTAAVAIVWTAILALAAVVQIYRLATRRFLLWSHLLFASVSCTILANWVLLEARDARYILAMNAPLAFLAGVEAADLFDRAGVTPRLRAAGVAAILALQAAAMIEFNGLTYMWWRNAPGSPSEARTLARVIDTLRARGVTRVYSTNALLQWQIAFYSREEVIARWKWRRDRYPRYVDAVDAARAHGEPTAIVGYAAYTGGLERIVADPAAIAGVDGKYFIYLHPSADELRRAGFDLEK